jgi:hypothetical protein
MPLLWSVNHGAKVVRLRLVEPLAFDDWFSVVDSILHDPSIDREYRIVVDRTAMSGPSDEYAQQMALFFARRQRILAQRRIAVLAQPAAVPALMPVQAVLNSRIGAYSRVFTKLDDAHAWLLECDDSLAPIPW